MAVRVADKIKQFNDSDFFLMDAEDVEMSDGKSVEEKFAEKGKPNGYAGLDKDGKIPTEQLPPIANATMLECEITDSDGGALLDSNGQPILGRINVINAITDINETIEKLKQHAILDSTF